MQAAPRGHRLPMAKTSSAAAVTGRRTSISGCASDWHRPNRHSCGRPSTSCGMPRGFLPWGLSNTCPQDGGMRASAACDGQVSDNPKQELPLAEGCFRVADLQVSQQRRSLWIGSGLRSCLDGTEICIIFP